jgi:FtsZ-binding cell division protein ZapB
MRPDNNYREKVLQVVQEARQPVDAENVRVQAGISNWQTSLKHLLELVVQGKINGEKTSKSWIFWRVDSNE